MFGLFSKKELAPNVFSNMLIATFSDSVRKTSSLPSAEQMLETFSNLLSSRNSKLTQEQISAVRLAALMIENDMFDFRAELLPLVNRLILETPKGGRKAYDEVITLLKKHHLIRDSEFLEF